MIHITFSKLFVIGVLGAHPVIAEQSAKSVFDPESQAYIRGKSRESGVGVFPWLMPYCTDLSPYADTSQREATPAVVAQYGYNHFQQKWLPESWKNESIENRLLTANETTWKVFRKVPNTVFPVRTVPNGNPIYFYIWHRKNPGVDITMTHSSLLKTHIVLTANTETQLQNDNLSDTELTRIAGEYFNLPPKGMLTPNNWAVKFLRDERNGRYISGRIMGTFEGKWRDGDPKRIGDGGSWGKNLASCGYFYFDGRCFALVVTPIKGQNARTMPVPPSDVDWDAVEKMDIGIIMNDR